MCVDVYPHQTKTNILPVGVERRTRGGGLSRESKVQFFSKNQIFQSH
jgi:hypothetical protein